MMRIPSLCLVLGSLFVVAAAYAQPTPSIPSLSQAQVERLNRGEVLVEVVEGEVPIGDAIGVIDAPPEAVMALVSDFARHSEFFDDTAVSEVVGQDGEYELQHGVTDTPWPMDDREWTLRAWHGTMEVDGLQVLVSTWEYVPDSGNIVDTEGYYLMIPWGDDGSKTLFRYHISVDLGTWLPDFLLEWSTENMLPNQVEALRAQL
jgi:hypothetical protein